MKKLLCLLLLITEISFAQLHLPELSPVGQVIQPVGYTTFQIRYGRPAARKRKIMGGLVPYKTLWRTGAGKCSTLSFDQEVVINNKTIPAGIYAFLAIPDEREWTVMLNTDTSKIYGHPSEYDIKNEVVRLQVNPVKTKRFYESLTFDLDIAHNDAIFVLSWENTRIEFPIFTLSHEKAVAEISKGLAADPENPERLAQASYYYFMNNESPDQILTWLDKALALGGDRWVYEQKVDVLERMKRYSDARKAASTAVDFLRKTKPVEWEEGVSNYEKRLKGLPKE
ncbi:MAG: DUF2911 domain-containing protein [Cyclobacteriaceae bacterium]